MKNRYKNNNTISTNEITTARGYNGLDGKAITNRKGRRNIPIILLTRNTINT
jgi:hypothetical protein